MLPALSSVRPCGPDAGVFSLNSLNCCVFGSNRPSTLAFMPVYQIDPSDAASGSCGRELGVGTSHSLNVTGVFPVVLDGPVEGTDGVAGAAGAAGDLVSAKFFVRYSMSTGTSWSERLAPRSSIWRTTSCHSSAVRPPPDVTWLTP